MSNTMNSERKKAFFDGWRGRVGLVASAPGNATEADFNDYRPDGVAVLTTRTPLFSSTVEGIRKMNEYVDAAALMLAENCFLDLILLSSTAGSFVNGPEYDREYAARMTADTGVKTITSSQCILEAFACFNASKITLVTPSAPDLNEAEKSYFAASGIEVVAEGGFHFSDPADIMRTDPRDVYKLVMESDVNEADAVLISCSGLHVMELLETLEKDLAKPVLASNQISLWGSLRALGLQDNIKGIGSLFL